MQKEFNATLTFTANVAGTNMKQTVNFDLSKVKTTDPNSPLHRLAAKRQLEFLDENQGSGNDKCNATCLLLVISENLTSTEVA